MDATDFPLSVGVREVMQELDLVPPFYPYLSLFFNILINSLIHYHYIINEERDMVNLFVDSLSSQVVTPASFDIDLCSYRQLELF